MAVRAMRPRYKGVLPLLDAMTRWPVCGRCCEVAYFSWMGGSHDCEQRSADTERLEVVLPEPPMYWECGTARRGRFNQQIMIDDNQLTHLVRFFERVHDDGEVSRLRVSVRAGTLQFFAAPWMYSAEVGYSESEC